MHFIGIGGIGMSGIAEILINLGYDVSGSDLRESEQTKRLRQLGATIYIGHYPSNIKDYHVVVTSSAISKNNPEIIEAKKRKIPVIHRSEMLAELVRLKHGIGVAGTHGKTTTSSMLAYVLYHGGLNPTAVVGGKVLNFGSNARIGEGQYFVFEADESDGSFIKLLPTIGIVTNIDADHLDHYKYFEGIKEAFITYMNNIPFYGYSVVCMDDPVVAEVLPRIERPYVTYGFNTGAHFKATNIKLLNGSTMYSCYYNDKLLGEIVLNLLGKHNIINSLAVVAVALELGLAFGVIAEAIAQFQGVGRRLEKIGETNGIVVVDDYGHHPTEIRATLDALKQLGKRVIVVFQPHRYTRTQYLYDEFGQAFTMADELFLTEIYPAGEEPIEGVSSNLIQQSVKKHEGRDVVVIPHLDQVPDYICSIVKEGDVIVTLGAGDIYKVGHTILSMLDKKGVVQ